VTIAIRLAESAADRLASWKIREQVFIGEQKIAEAIERDGLDDVAWHFVAWDGPVACGTARVLGLDDDHEPTSPAVSKVVKIGRMAVLPDWRRLGIGRLLLDAALEFARAYGVEQAELSAQEYVVKFYERAGFVAAGERYDEAGIPHQWMSRRL
jgi:predicted GNAT family N-acyltransferase